MQRLRQRENRPLATALFPSPRQLGAASPEVARDIGVQIEGEADRDRRPRGCLDRVDHVQGAGPAVKGERPAMDGALCRISVMGGFDDRDVPGVDAVMPEQAGARPGEP